jgi:hypothetical protein
MSIIADGHLHIYPFYNLPTLLEHLAVNLAAHAGDAVRVALLAERHDCHALHDMPRQATLLSNRGWSISAEPCGACLLSRDGDAPLYIIAGRQVVTAERLEVLALTTDTDIPDGLTAGESIERVKNVGALPVLAWAPGKWFGKRGKIVRQLIDAAAPGELLIGDTSLRPTCWAEPLLMRRARRKGLRVLCGSDPLPFAGEERLAGTYATVLDAEFDPTCPVESMRAALRDASVSVRHAGRRGGPLDVLRRLRRNAAAK